MRNRSALAAAAALIMGAVGCVLKNIEFNTILSLPGIKAEWQPVTVALALLTLAAAALGVGLSFFAFKDKRTAVIRQEGPMVAVSALGAALTAVGIVMLYMENKNSLTPAAVIFTVLGLFAAAGIVVPAVYPDKKANSASRIMCVMPSVFCCMWLVTVYRQYSAEPQLIVYVYRCLSIAAITMAYYYSSGFFYGRERGKTVFSVSFFAIYLAVMILGESTYMWEKLLTAGFAFGIVSNLLSMDNEEQSLDSEEWSEI